MHYCIIECERCGTFIMRLLRNSLPLIQLKPQRGIQLTFDRLASLIEVEGIEH